MEEKIDAYRHETAPKSDCTLTLSQLFEEWFISIQYRIKKSTAANYRMKASKHILPKFGDFSISKLGSADINAFVKSKFDAGFSYRYVADIVILMKSLFKYAAQVYHVFNSMSEVVLSHKVTSENKALAVWCLVLCNTLGIQSLCHSIGSQRGYDEQFKMHLTVSVSSSIPVKNPSMSLYP